MASSDSQDANNSFGFKKFMDNVASTSKLFATTKTLDTNHSDNNTSTTTKPVKTVQELEDEIEILKLQKADLRKLVQDRTYKLDQLSKLNNEHQKVRKRWQENEEKAANKVKSISAHSEEMKGQIDELKKQNALLQSKSTNNDLIKNKLETKLHETLGDLNKTKKQMERKNQEKKMLIAEVKKLRNEKIELTEMYKREIDKLNKNNTNNIAQLKQLNEQQHKSVSIAHFAEMSALKRKYKELDALHIAFRGLVVNRLSDIDSTTKAFEKMIRNANIGCLSEDECNKILDNIINSIESLEMDNGNCKGNKSEMKDDESGSEDEEVLLNGIEGRMLRSLKEKALLQRSTNHLMFQLQDLQKQHDIKIKEKNATIKRHEIRAKVRFFKKKRSNTIK